MGDIVGYGDKQGNIWGWVKTLVPSEPQNSWQMDVHPTKNVSIGIDPYPDLYHYEL